MPIPEISKANVLAALKKIDQEGVPNNRHSTRYCLVYSGHRYPPKYVVSLAVHDATGTELDSSQFSGGVETNSLLQNLGFSIVNIRYANDKVDAHSTEYQNSLIGRIVVDWQPNNTSAAQAILLDLLKNHWQQGLHLKFLITQGGFVKILFPSTWHGLEFK
ncbi:hypothetical protein HUU62_03810 [Rhodoferax sp. 4810]|uniref:ScoMcrA-like N-terminal head domain-containing protein n=1 Tax=Thiospirillum jenense TaxID=1653858 RepID=A0A839HJ24_9GAMM|nr:hypothetical protein [Thiospirillum jenense]MBB1073534.1 hypothetical protein [Rhodoferax jenense]MBB1126022.1 hypothetical protein [Thiospirillum jenense]